ncbi:MAG: hypothetical protein HY038_01280 [Nitrospirae bacterium]|nr:hypothetical protein [Nitrospirota bacterium]
MTEKKSYSPPQLYEVTLDQEQAILTACSLTTVSVAAGAGTNGCRVNGRCESPMCGGSAGGCKRSSLVLVCGGVTCHDSGVRAS